MTYMMSSQIELLQVKDAQGILYSHYHQPPAGDGQARVRGPVIDYIGPEYLKRWLDLGLVTEIVGEPEPQRRALPEPAPVPASARYRLTGKAPALYVKDPSGKEWFHVFDPVIAASTEGARGPEIDWLSAAQSSVFLLQGFVEQVGAEPAPAAQPAGEYEPVDDSSPDLSQEGIDECVRSLDRLGVPADSGAPTCRLALREAGESHSNATIALAVRARKALSETAVTP
jgi:cytochrome c oxidase cbb3-type subunit 2